MVSNEIRLWINSHSDSIVENTTPGLEVRPFLTGKGRDRMDMDKELNSITENGGRSWVYLSGPNMFIEAGESACRRSGVDFFGARWT